MPNPAKTVPGYRVVQHADGGFIQLHQFDVVRSSDGQVVNGHPLGPCELDRLLRTLPGVRIAAKKEEVHVMANQGDGQELMWRNKSGPFLLHRSLPGGTKEIRDIRPGEIFKAMPGDIPRAFRDTVVPVEAKELEAAEAGPEIQVAPPAYRMVPSSLPGRFNVVDGQGKVVNDKCLTKIKARELLEALV